MSFPNNLMHSTKYPNPMVSDEAPLDLSLKSNFLKRAYNTPTILFQPCMMYNSPSSFVKNQKRPHICSHYCDKSAVEWAIPKPPKLSRRARIPEFTKEPEELCGRFENIGPHLGYNAAQEGLQKAAEHLKKYAGQSLQAFLKAAYCFEQAAVSARSLKGEADAREYLEKAAASRSIARMAENLALLEKIVAEGFLKDAEKMHARCKLDQILMKKHVLKRQ